MSYMKTRHIKQVSGDYRCSDYGDLCTISEETFDYQGTHCTFGKSGTHHTGHYTSDCCDAEIELVYIGDDNEAE